MPPSLTIAEIRERLDGPLPGAEAHARMGTRPRVRPQPEPSGPPREGAVLILLYPRDGALWLPLIRRSEHLLHHSGQIALPGGQREPHDDGLWETALREAAEEVGIAPHAVERLGTLSPLYIPVSHFCLQPYVGYAAQRPAFRLDPFEVAALIELPLAVIGDRSHRREETWELHGVPVRVPYISYGDEIIWGATAMILSELEGVLCDARRG